MTKYFAIDKVQTSQFFIKLKGDVMCCKAGLQNYKELLPLDVVSGAQSEYITSFSSCAICAKRLNLLFLLT